MAMRAVSVICGRSGRPRRWRRNTWGDGSEERVVFTKALLRAIAFLIIKKKRHGSLLHNSSSKRREQMND